MSQPLLFSATARTSTASIKQSLVAVWEAHGTIWVTAIGVSLLNLLMVR